MRFPERLKVRNLLNILNTYFRITIFPNGKNWLDHIRSKSNEANHEIVIMKRDEADDLISFTEMLLRLVFEFKHRLIKKDSNSQD